MSLIPHTSSNRPHLCGERSPQATIPARIALKNTPKKFFVSKSLKQPSGRVKTTSSDLSRKTRHYFNHGGNRQCFRETSSPQAKIPASFTLVTRRQVFFLSNILKNNNRGPKQEIPISAEKCNITSISGATGTVSAQQSTQDKQSFSHLQYCYTL